MKGQQIFLLQTKVWDLVKVCGVERYRYNGYSTLRAFEEREAANEAALALNAKHICDVMPLMFLTDVTNEKNQSILDQLHEQLSKIIEWKKYSPWEIAGSRPFFNYVDVAVEGWVDGPEKQVGWRLPSDLSFEQKCEAVRIFSDVCHLNLYSVCIMTLE